MSKGVASEQVLSSAADEVKMPYKAEDAARVDVLLPVQAQEPQSMEAIAAQFDVKPLGGLVVSSGESSSSEVVAQVTPKVQSAVALPQKQKE